jgi:hypothetical protein
MAKVKTFFTIGECFNGTPTPDVIVGFATFIHVLLTGRHVNAPKQQP